MLNVQLYGSFIIKELFNKSCFLLQCVCLYIRRWADKFCLHCNIFIYIGHNMDKSGSV